MFQKPTVGGGVPPDGTGVTTYCGKMWRLKAFSLLCRPLKYVHTTSIMCSDWIGMGSFLEREPLTGIRVSQVGSLAPVGSCVLSPSTLQDVHVARGGGAHDEKHPARASWAFGPSNGHRMLLQTLENA
jgi:hypothetical protein